MNATSENKDLERVVEIDEQIAYHEQKITALMAERSKLTSLNSSATQIIRVVCAVCEVPETVLLSKRRPNHVALARQMAMTLIYQRLCWAQERTGLLFNRDHGTVGHAVQTVQDRVATEPLVAEQWNQILHRLDGPAVQPEAA